MATLQELHERVGNPDLSHWKTRKMLTIAESALLTAGFDPLLYEEFSDDQLLYELRRYQPQNWQHASMLIKSISEAVCTSEIKAPRVILEYPYNQDWETKEQIEINIEDEPYLRTTLTKIHRDELFKWLKRNGYFDLPQSKIIAPKQTSYKTELLQNNNITLLPQHTYKTHALEALNGVIQEFWINYDPDGNQPPPKQNTVASWIRENYPNVQGNELCIYIDKICRHPNARKGGNTKINQSNTLKDVTPIK